MGKVYTLDDNGERMAEPKAMHEDNNYNPLPQPEEGKEAA